MISRSSDILILSSAGGHFELWRPSCIDKYSLVYGMELSEIKYIISGILIIILSPKSPFVNFLLKRKGGILYFNGHVTYDLPMTPKITLSSKWHYGISKPELRAKKHISMIAVTVFIADYFFVAAILEICKLAN